MLMGWGWSDTAGLPCLLELDDNEGFCWCCGGCWRPVGTGSLPSTRTMHLPPAPFAEVRPLCCGAPLRPSRHFHSLPRTTTSTPSPPRSTSQSGVDIACTNSDTSARQRDRPKALATYPGSPHTAFVVRVYRLAGWLGGWLVD